LENLITNRYRLEEINKGFNDLEAGKNARGVIMYESGEKHDHGPYR